ncbi:MAG: cytochrome c oxidase subunit 3 [Caldilineaceae bacterium]
MQQPIWPYDRMPLPDLLLPGIATAVTRPGTAAMYWANRRIGRHNDTVSLRAGLLTAFLLGAVAVLCVYLDLRRVPFDHTMNAYGSLYYTLSIFGALIIVGGMAQNLFTQVWAWAGRYTAREHVAVDIGALYWYAALALWLILAGTVYLSPHMV